MVWGSLYLRCAFVLCACCKAVYVIVTYKNTELAVRFQGLASPAALTCEYPVGEKHKSPEWDMDVTLSKLVRQGRISGQMALS